MPDTKISALTAGDPALSTDAIPISRAGANFKVTAGSIAALSPAGTVTSVGGTGTVNGITLTGTVTSSGSLTLGGALSGVSLTTQVSGTLPTASGGTNLTSFTSGGAVYATSTSALTTGTLPLASGGTGQTTASAAFNALSPVTTTGDLILGNGTNSSTRLPIGTNGYVLTSNGTTASWQAGGGGGGGVTSFSAGTTGLNPGGATTGAVTLSGTLGIGNGGTNNTTFPTNGQILIGSFGSYSVANLTAGGGISITNGSGSITIAATGGGGAAYISYFQFTDGASYANGPSFPTQQSPVVYWDAGANTGTLWFYSPSGGFNASGFSCTGITVTDNLGVTTTYTVGADFNGFVNAWYANGNTVGLYGINISNVALRALMASTAAQLGAPAIAPRANSAFSPQSSVFASVSSGLNPSYSSSGYPIMVTPTGFAGSYNIKFRSFNPTNDPSLTLNSLIITNNAGSPASYFNGIDFTAFLAQNTTNEEFSCQIGIITNATLTTLLDNSIIT